MICNPSFTHGPHLMHRGPHKGETCQGATDSDVRYHQIRKQEALKTEAHKFTTRYGIHVSAASLRANPGIWQEVERALEREYDRGYRAGKG